MRCVYVCSVLGLVAQQHQSLDGCLTTVQLSSVGRTDGKTEQQVEAGAAGGPPRQHAVQR